MEERKFINLKKEEFGIKEHIKRNLGKGKISRLDIEYTPVGEKIIILTNKPGFVIGKRGEKIEELTQVLKTKFKLENPHIEINEIKNPLFDAQLVADEITMALERMGNLKFKVIAYRKLQEIMNAGALGCELRISGKLPGDRAKSWRFAQGYLKKAGESRKEVNRAQAVALTKSGIIGIKVAIMPKDAIIYDAIDINDKIREQLKKGVIEELKNKPSKNITKTIKSKKESKKPKENLKEETKIIEESKNLEIKPEEDGTAIKIEEELEEGVPQEQIDKDLQNNKIIKPKKLKEDAQ
jgi:small subunit ribosomal protein S3